MAMEITLEQFLATPFVLKLIQRIKTPSSLFQNFYGMTVGGTAYDQFSGRNVSWDIMDPSRRLARVVAPQAPPASVGQQPSAVQTAYALRMHEKIMLLQDKIFRYRPLGGQVGVVDKGGQNYMTRQIKVGTQRFRNSREFMVNRLFRGGFGLKRFGDVYDLCEINDASVEITVDSLIPSSNKNQLELDTGASVIDAPWDDPSADVIGQLYSVNAAYERMHGWPLRHIWISTPTFTDLLNNVGLQSVGGTAYRVWDSLSRRELTSEEGIPDTGFDVVFRALPLFTFHVYDAVLSLDVDTPDFDQTTAANTSKLVPDNNAILTPEPSDDWCGWLAGSEMVAENLWDAGQERFGFHTWTTRVIDPAGWEMKFVDNGLPALFVPKAVCYATVKGF